MLTVSKLMHRDAIKISPDNTLEEIEKIMGRVGVNHVLVMDAGELVGIISDRDVARHRSILAGTQVARTQDNATLSLKAHQIMTRKPLVVCEDALVSVAIGLFEKKRIHSLPVVDRAGKVSGILTDHDLLRFLLRVCNLFED